MGVLPATSSLAGLRVSLGIQQDHPHPVFEGLLREALLREEAVVDDASALRIEGEVVGNGYADVYFRAEITVMLGNETLFVLTDKPPHGDRPANLAAEVVQRLRDELAKRERQGALRELRG